VSVIYKVNGPYILKLVIKKCCRKENPLATYSHTSYYCCALKELETWEILQLNGSHSEEYLKIRHRNKETSEMKKKNMAALLGIRPSSSLI
jgi:hypothetical protein